MIAVGKREPLAARTLAPAFLAGPRFFVVLDFAGRPRFLGATGLVASSSSLSEAAGAAGGSIDISLVVSVDLSFGRSLSVDGSVVVSAGSNFLLDNFSLDLLDQSSALFLALIVRSSSGLAFLATGLLCSSSGLGRTTTLLCSGLCLLLFVVVLSLSSTLVFILRLGSDFLALLGGASLSTTFLGRASGGGGSVASSRASDLLAADLVPAGAGDAGVFVAQFAGDGVPVGLQNRDTLALSWFNGVWWWETEGKEEGWMEEEKEVM